MPKKKTPFIKSVNHFLPNDLQTSLFSACDRGAGISHITNNFDKHLYLINWGDVTIPIRNAERKLRNFETPVTSEIEMNLY
jgi:hypothetical protein